MTPKSPRSEETDATSARLCTAAASLSTLTSTRIAGSLAAVTEVYGEVQRAAGAAERIRELMAAKSDITSAADCGHEVEFEARLRP